MDRIIQFFINNAYAETPGSLVPSPQGGGMSFVIMLVIFFLFMYFFILRPQSKRAKEQQKLLNSLAKGDEVVTAGGLLGRISKISEQYVALSVTNNTDILIQKSSIVNVLPKGTLKTIE